MPRTKQQPSSENGFAERLIRLRKRSGLTQIELAEKIDSSQRTLSHYETGRGYPPAPTIVKLAKALNVSADELLGITKPRTKQKELSPELKHLWKKFQQVAKWPEKDQRAVIRLINSLSKKTA